MRGGTQMMTTPYSNSISTFLCVAGAIALAPEGSA
jgi:hypothetical protein